MASLDMSLFDMIRNNRRNGVRGGGRGRGLRGVRGPGGTFGGATGLDGHPCRGPLGLRGVRGPGGTFGGSRRLDGHPCRGPLGLKGVRGPGCTFRGARRLDGRPCRGPLGLRGVRGPGGTLRGVRQLDGPPRHGRVGMYAITKTMHGPRNLPAGDSVLEDGFKAEGASGAENGTKLQVSNLNAGVSNDDIRGLFSEIGELIRYGIHYDKNGSPCGSAEVVFARSSDAFEAVKRYNNTELDGKPMKIEKVGSIERAHVASRLNMISGTNGRRSACMMRGPGYMRDASILNTTAGSSSRRARGGWNGALPLRGRGGRGRGRGHGHGGLGGRPMEKSAEELDKELENYQAETSQI